MSGYGKFETLVCGGSVHPSVDDAVDIGNSTFEFKDLYIDGSAYIDGLADDILVDTDKKIQFRDTGIYIQSSANGKLTISADGGSTDDITLSGQVTIDDNVTIAEGKTVSGAVNGASGLTLKNLKNTAASGLSGTQVDIGIELGGVPYYFTVYPTKA